MTMTAEQASWFAGTFDKLVANVGQAVLGKSQVVRLTYIIRSACRVLHQIE